MVITEEHKLLIEKIVTSNKRFQGNEDLFEDFCAEAMERSLFLLERTDTIDRVQNYLTKLISNSMISVLKTSGRITRDASGYTKTPVNLENPLDNGYFDIKDTTINFTEKLVEEETLQEIYANVVLLDKQFPDEKYSKIFYAKYVQNKKQREIAAQFGISQGEVSKRLFKLMKQISIKMQ